MSDTLARLAESRFFFELLLNTNRNKPEFQHYLNAFVKAARSITWIMRHEFSHISGWQQWYDSYKLNKKDEKILKIFNKLRIKSEKMGPIKDDMMLQIKVGESIKKELSKYLPPFGEMIELEITAAETEEEASKIRDTGLRITDEKISFPVESSNMELYYRIEGVEGHDTIELCEQYFDIISRLVVDCFVRFHHVIQISSQQV